MLDRSAAAVVVQVGTAAGRCRVAAAGGTFAVRSLDGSSGPEEERGTVVVARVAVLARGAIVAAAVAAVEAAVVHRRPAAAEGGNMV